MFKAMYIDTQKKFEKNVSIHTMSDHFARIEKDVLAEWHDCSVCSADRLGDIHYECG